MKYQINPAPDTFKPVSITLTFESQAELDAMKTIANSMAICNWMQKTCGSSLYYGWFNELGAGPGFSEDLKNHLRKEL